MKLQCLKLFIMKKKIFLEDFRQISLVGSLNKTLYYYENSQ